MHNAKFKYLIKTVYAWVDLVYKIFPFFLFISIIPIVISAQSTLGILLHSMDLFKFSGPLGELAKENNYYSIFSLISLFLKIVIFVIVYICIKKLRDFIKNVSEGSPLCEANGRYLKFIGLSISILVFILHFINVLLISVFWGAGFVSFGITVLIAVMGILTVIFNPYLIVGLLVLILGEILLNGAKLKEENDLTV